MEIDKQEEIVEISRKPVNNNNNNNSSKQQAGNNQGVVSKSALGCQDLKENTVSWLQLSGTKAKSFTMSHHLMNKKGSYIENSWGKWAKNFRVQNEICAFGQAFMFQPGVDETKERRVKEFLAKKEGIDNLDAFAITSLLSNLSNEQTKQGNIVKSVVISLDKCVTVVRGNERPIISKFNALYFDVKLNDGKYITPGSDLSESGNFQKWILALLGIENTENHNLLELFSISGIIKGLKTAKKKPEEQEAYSAGGNSLKYLNSVYYLGATLWGVINEVIETAVKGAGNETALISIPLVGGKLLEYFPVEAEEEMESHPFVSISNLILQSGARSSVVMGSGLMSIQGSSSSASPKRGTSESKVKKMEKDTQKEQNEKEKKALEPLRKNISDRNSKISVSRNTENGKTFESKENKSSLTGKEEIEKAMNEINIKFSLTKNAKEEFPKFMKNFNLEVKIKDDTMTVKEEEIDYNGIFAPYVFDEKYLPKAKESMFETAQDKNIHLTETGVNYFRGIKKWIDDGAKCFITTLYAFHSDSMLSLVKKIFEVIQSGNESNNQKKLQFLKYYKQLLCKSLPFESRNYKIFYPALLYFYFCFSLNTLLDNLGDRTKEAQELCGFLLTTITSMFQFVLPCKDQATKYIIAENPHSRIEKIVSEQNEIDKFNEHIVNTLGLIEKAQKSSFSNKKWSDNCDNWLKIFQDYFFGFAFNKVKFLVPVVDCEEDEEEEELEYGEILFCTVDYPKLTEQRVKELATMGINVDLKVSTYDYHKMKITHYFKYLENFNRLSSAKKVGGDKSSTTTYGKGVVKFDAPDYKEQSLLFYSSESKKIRPFEFSLPFSFYQSLTDGNIIKSLLDNVCNHKTNLGLGESGKKSLSHDEKKELSKVIDGLVKKGFGKKLEKAKEKRKKEEKKSKKQSKSKKTSSKKGEKKEKVDEDDEEEEEEKPVTKATKGKSSSTENKAPRKHVTAKAARKSSVIQEKPKQTPIKTFSEFAEEESDKSSSDESSKSESSSSDDEDKMDVAKEAPKIAEKPKKVVEQSPTKSPSKQQKETKTTKSSDVGNKKEIKDDDENLSKLFDVVLGGKKFISYFDEKEKDPKLEHERELVYYTVLVFKLLEIHKSITTSISGKGKQKTEVVKFIQDKLNSLGNLFKVYEENKKNPELDKLIVEIVGDKHDILRSTFGGTEISNVFGQDNINWLYKFLHDNENHIFREPICRRISSITTFEKRYDYAFDMSAILRYVKLWYDIEIKNDPDEDTKLWQEVDNATDDNEKTMEMVKYYTYEKYIQKINSRKFQESIAASNFYLGETPANTPANFPPQSPVKTPSSSPFPYNFTQQEFDDVASLTLASLGTQQEDHMESQYTDTPAEPPVEVPGLPRDDNQEE